MRAEIVKAWKAVLQQDSFAISQHTLGNVQHYGNCVYALEGKHCVVGHLLRGLGVPASALAEIDGSVTPALRALELKGYEFPDLWEGRNRAMLANCQKLHDTAAQRSAGRGLTNRWALTNVLISPPHMTHPDLAQEAFDILTEALDA